MVLTQARLCDMGHVTPCVGLSQGDIGAEDEQPWVCFPLEVTLLLGLLKNRAGKRVQVHTHKHGCAHTNVSIHTNMQVHTQTCRCARTQTWRHTHTNMQVQTNMQVCTHTNMQAYTETSRCVHTNMRVQTQTCRCAQTQIPHFPTLVGNQFRCLLGYVMIHRYLYIYKILILFLH